MLVLASLQQRYRPNGPPDALDRFHILNFQPQGNLWAQSKRIFDNTQPFSNKAARNGVTQLYRIYVDFAMLAGEISPEWTSRCTGSCPYSYFAAPRDPMSQIQKDFWLHPVVFEWHCAQLRDAIVTVFKDLSWILLRLADSDDLTHLRRLKASYRSEMVNRTAKSRIGRVLVPTNPRLMEIS